MKRQTLVGLGTLTGPGLLHVLDADHDGLGEFCFAGKTEEFGDRMWGIAEYRAVNSFELVYADTGPGNTRDLDLGNFTPCAVCDLDRDGLVEILGEVPYLDTTSYGWRQLVCTVESRDSISLPDTLANRCYVDSVNPNGYDRVLVADLDQDSLFEVVGQWYPGGFAVYEYDGVSACSLVYYFYEHGVSTDPRTWGDFDQNGRMDLVTDGILAPYAEYIFECTGDNQFAMVCSVATGWTNHYDHFTGHDVDQNGRPEFFVLFYRYSDRKFALFMLEAVAEHNYVCYAVDSLTVWDFGIASGNCADLDGDGHEELIWAVYSQVQVKKPIGPHSFETVYTWVNDHGRPTTVCAVADHNRNGYNELYVSSNLQTSMLEVEAVRVLHPDTGPEFVPGETCWVRWNTFSPPRCDSVSLFLLTDTVVPQGEWFWNLDTIATGLSPTDSMYPWVVPNAVTDAAWIVALAYGPGWQFDRSDSAFAIRPLGMVGRAKNNGAVPVVCTPTVVGRMLLMPERSEGTELLDIMGRRVMNLQPGANDIRHLNPGVYFVRREENRSTTKVIIQR